ncbi:MAG: hypothetical protein LUI13_08620 [Lachnospiraceae bacterium]|nr:hypothetical protein [Lachnospiraceae bacterium]
MQLRKVRNNVPRSWAVLGLAAVMALTLTACGSDGGSSSSDSSSGSANEASASSGSTGNTADSSDGFTFTYEGTVIGMGEEAGSILEALGDDYDYFESESCAFDGLDKVYTYSHFKLNTYPSDDIDYVLSIVFRDDTIETDEGITIGSSKDDVLEAYGDPDEEKTASLVYEKGNTSITFGITGDSVSTVTIAAKTE